MQTGKALASRRGEGAFGSSDSYWVQAITNNHPKFMLRINGKLFTGILDTGADVSVIAERHWPRKWPKPIAISTLQGIGQTNNTEQSTKLLH